MLKTPVKTGVPIGRLKSNFSHFREEYLKAGFDVFGVTVKELPHYKMLKQFEANKSLDLTTTEYYRLVEFADSIRFHKGHNIGQRGCARLVKFYDQPEKVKQDPIEVKATHDGWFFVANGLHRASVAAALGWKTIPAIIRGVDTELAGLLKEVKDLAYGPHKGSRTLYTAIEHPIFENWTVLKNGSRWSLIEQEFDWNGKAVLDVGSYTGYFSHRVAKMGANVIGIETNPLKVQVAKQLNTLLRLGVDFLQIDMFDYLKEPKRFDCILFLEVLHWILKNDGEKRARQALQLVSASAPTMFFVMRRMKLPVGKIGPLVSKDAISTFVLSASSYDKAKWLGLSTCSRDVFKFTR